MENMKMINYTRYEYKVTSIQNKIVKKKKNLTLTFKCKI